MCEAALDKPIGPPVEAVKNAKPAKDNVFVVVSDSGADVEDGATDSDEVVEVLSHLPSRMSPRERER